jgi:hypothetical protein
MIETLSRLSLGSSDVQVSQWQAIEGTPVEVPVPRKISLIRKTCFDLCSLFFGVRPGRVRDHSREVTERTKM